jgi:ribosome-associated toxin RatA of RatAB toxin-antitoxin module
VTHVQRSAIVPYTPEQMYGLVVDVERYPEFLPWCSGAAVLTRDAAGATARLSLSRGPAHGSFTTRNEFQAPNQVAMHLVDGPFESLEGLWRFQRIGDAGCRVSLDIQFRMRHALAALLLGRVFEKSCDQLVDAFCRRAAQVYG